MAAKDRARAIVIESGALLLIERRRSGERYWVFPGGGIDPGETAEDAAIREVREETGLIVRLEGLVAIELSDGRRQFFFTARVTGGELGTGDGPEMSAAEDDDSGSYEPIWMPLDRVAAETIYPAAAAKLVDESTRAGWRDDVIALPDSGWRSVKKRRQR